MKILVCVSHVPDTTTRIQFSADGKQVERGSIQYIINPYDELALSRALEMKEQAGGTVTTITVGDASTEPTIRKCLAIGADDAIRVNAEPADGYFVAQQIAQAATGQGYDLIFTGRESIDYNGGIVGGMVAELLNLPFVNVVTKIDVAGGTATVERDIDGGREVVQVATPLVVSAQKELTEPRIPNMRGIMAARTKPLKVMDAQGQAATAVLAYEAPKAKAACHFFTIDQMDELVAALHNEAKVI